MKSEFKPANPLRFEQALRRFDEENSRDPNREWVAGVAQPRELTYAGWLTDWVLRLKPDASEELRLAARSQHLCRWEIPRHSFPMDRSGYLRWRAQLKKFHARKAAAILSEAGYTAETIERVKRLNLKSDFPNDPDGRVLEDALCLVFLEHQFASLASRTADHKMVNALQKSWQKMTPAARAEALQLAYTPAQRALIEMALNGR